MEVVITLSGGFKWHTGGHGTHGVQELMAFMEFVIQENIHTRVEKGKIRKGTSRHQQIGETWVIYDRYFLLPNWEYQYFLFQFLFYNSLPLQI